MGKVIRVYGTYWGERRLAWVGFADRFYNEFYRAGTNICFRRISLEFNGWDQTYTVE